MLRLKLLLSVSLIMGAAALQVGCDNKPAYQVPPPPKVTTVTPVVETVPIFLEENGETEAVEQAVVQSRVRGILEEIKISPDSPVVEGETVMFVIEQREYEAAVQAAKAAVSSSAAALNATKAALGVADARIAATIAEINVRKAEFDRSERLLKNNAIAQSEMDTATANLETANAAKQGAEAAKTAAEAEINNAAAALEKAQADLIQSEIELERTVIVAPISGRVTKTLVKRGNLVENGTPLVEIVKNEPIWANFNINERFLLTLERRTKREIGEDKRVKGNIVVKLKRSGDKDFTFTGLLDYFAPKVDQDTGTLKVRAVFDNKDSEKLLLPGLFVRVQVQIGNIENAILIPERAVNRDQTGAFIYVVDSENKAVRTPVSLGTRYQTMIVVESGIEPTDSIIVDGLQRVRPGIEVAPTPLAKKANSPAPAKSPPPARD